MTKTLIKYLKKLLPKPSKQMLGEIDFDSKSINPKDRDWICVKPINSKPYDYEANKEEDDKVLESMKKALNSLK